MPFTPAIFKSSNRSQASLGSQDPSKPPPLPQHHQQNQQHQQHQQQQQHYDHQDHHDDHHRHHQHQHQHARALAQVSQPGPPQAFATPLPSPTVTHAPTTSDRASASSLQDRLSTAPEYLDPTLDPREREQAGRGLHYGPTTASQAPPPPPPPPLSYSIHAHPPVSTVGAGAVTGPAAGVAHPTTAEAVSVEGAAGDHRPQSAFLAADDHSSVQDSKKSKRRFFGFGHSSKESQRQTASDQHQHQHQQHQQQAQPPSSQQQQQQQHQHQQHQHPQSPSQHGSTAGLGRRISLRRKDTPAALRQPPHSPTETPDRYQWSSGRTSTPYLAPSAEEEEEHDDGRKGARTPVDGPDSILGQAHPHPHQHPHPHPHPQQEGLSHSRVEYPADRIANQHPPLQPADDPHRPATLDPGQSDPVYRDHYAPQQDEVFSPPPRQQSFHQPVPYQQQVQRPGTHQPPHYHTYQPHPGPSDTPGAHPDQPRPDAQQQQHQPHQPHQPPPPPSYLPQPDQRHTIATAQQYAALAQHPHQQPSAYDQAPPGQSGHDPPPNLGHPVVVDREMGPPRSQSFQSRRTGDDQSQMPSSAPSRESSSLSAYGHGGQGYTQASHPANVSAGSRQSMPAPASQAYRGGHPQQPQLPAEHGRSVSPQVRVREDGGGGGGGGGSGSSIAGGTNAATTTTTTTNTGTGAVELPMYQELQQKYSKVKKLYFEKTSMVEQYQSQVEQLQNVIANQRLSQSRTSLDDNEYTTRFSRLDGAISNLCFNVRKDWKSVPAWLQPVVTDDACSKGTKEMTIAGRAFISRWIVEELLERYFHPAIDPTLSLQLKSIEMNLRLLAATPQTREEEEALIQRISTWRLATMDGLPDVLHSAQGVQNRAKLTHLLEEQLGAALQAHLNDPPPPGVSEGISSIVQLAVGLAANLHLESRDVFVYYPAPGSLITTAKAKIETGLPALSRRGTNELGSGGGAGGGSGGDATDLLSLSGAETSSQLSESRDHASSISEGRTGPSGRRDSDTSSHKEHAPSTKKKTTKLGGLIGGKKQSHGAAAAAAAAAESSTSRPSSSSTATAATAGMPGQQQQSSSSSLAPPGQPLSQQQQQQQQSQGGGGGSGGGGAGTGSGSANGSSAPTAEDTPGATGTSGAVGGVAGSSGSGVGADGMPTKVRIAGFMSVEVRGRSVLVKAPVWTF